MIRTFVLGIIVTIVVIALVIYFGITSGRLLPANADAKPSKIERWAASRSLRATVQREAPKGNAPVPLTDQNLLAGIKSYGENCAVCHGTAQGDRSATNIAKGLYQKPPQLGGDDGVEDDPVGVTFWKVKHGIRLTGMPAFAKTLNDTQIWQLAVFLKNMNKLPPAPNHAWHAIKT